MARTSNNKKGYCTMRITRSVLYSFSLLLASQLMTVGPARATNGMNMEGYGPIALGLGGSAMAYDNGNAAVINNPATLGLNQDTRLDLALGFLGPDVETRRNGQTWNSQAEAFYMPAFGWSRTQGRFTYGIASFAQGGMGTEFDAGPGAAATAELLNAGITATGAAAPSAATVAAVAGLQERTEIGVGRLMIPLAYAVGERLILGGTVDFVWATMDLQMVMSGKQMFDMIGAGQIGGDMVTALQGAMGAGQVQDLYYGYFDFSDDNDFSGKAGSSGFAAKIGLVYRAGEHLRIGAVYHGKVKLDEFDGRANVNMAVSADTGFLGGGALSGSYTDATFPLRGDISIRNFSWPAMLAAGIAWEPGERWLLVADLKHIDWSAAMKSFSMSFKADDSAANGAFAGLTMKATLPQDWDDQLVLTAGAAYRATDRFTLRAGFNLADNPVPDRTLLYLFPAIVENHYTAGLGITFNERQQLHLGLSYAPEVKATNPASGMESRHSQLNWQVMYSHFF